MARPCTECRYRSENPYMRRETRTCHAPEARKFNIVDGYSEPTCGLVRYDQGDWNECKYFKGKVTLIGIIKELFS